MYSLVVPVFKNEESIFDLVHIIGEINKRLDKKLEAVFVVDGSPDKSYSILATMLPKVSFQAQLIQHSRNFGSFAAIRTGLEHSRGNFCAVMAADLQEPPELILEIFQLLRSGALDIVYGVRRARNDPFLTKFSAFLFWSFYRKYISESIPKGGVDIFGCNALVRTQLLRFSESHSSLVAQVFWLGFRTKAVEYDRQIREKGKSAWTFSKKLKYFFDSIFSFTNLPIKALVAIGVLGVLSSIVLASVVVLFKIFGKIPVSGYTALLISIVFFGALNLLGIGIVGAYVHRAYENTKLRPLSVVMTHEIIKRKFKRS